MKGRLLAAAAITLVLLITALSAGDKRIGFTNSIYSTSPKNPSPYGTSKLYAEASKRWKTVIIDDVGRLEAYNDRIVYIVIGPDKPFTSKEISVIKKLASEGRLNILIADETTISGTLVSSMTGARIAPSILTDPGKRLGYTFIIDIECMDAGRGLASRTSYIDSIPINATPICMARGTYKAGEIEVENPAIGIYYRGGGYEAIVIADSSMCANFMTTESPWNRGGNMHICMSIIEKLAGNTSTIIAFDAGHYEGSDITLRLGPIALGILALPHTALKGLTGPGPWMLYAVTLALAGILVNALFNAYRPSTPAYPESWMVYKFLKHSRDPITILAYRLGLRGYAARRLLGELRRRGR